MEFLIWDVEFGVHGCRGSGQSTHDRGFRARSLEYTVHGLGFRVQGSGFRA